MVVFAEGAGFEPAELLLAQLDLESSVLNHSNQPWLTSHAKLTKAQ